MPFRSLAPSHSDSRRANLLLIDFHHALRYDLPRISSAWYAQVANLQKIQKRPGGPLAVMTQDRRGSVHNSRHTASPWQRVTQVISVVVVAYFALLGLMVWWAIHLMPASQDRHVLLIMGMTAALTIVLLASIRVIVRRHLVVPLQQQAEHDDLTELCRPGAFWEQADERRIQAIQTHEPLAFVFIDLDDFKQVNDTYGHLTGDALLRDFSRLLQTQARHEDILGRLGGEEFGWVLPGASVQDAQTATERLLGMCRRMEIGTLRGVTFSAGIAAIKGPESDPPSTWDLARCADHALYQAKAAGKAQVRIAPHTSA